ncbi:Serine/threonine-protein kinase atg1 [Balamuthia mandrillaris]
MEHTKAFSVGDYNSNGKRIGRGAFATVYLAQHKDTHEVVAIKVVDVERLSKHNQKLKKHLESEINIMKALKHENIVLQHDVVLGSEFIYLVLEYCEGGDFSQFLKRHGKLSESRARFFLSQLAAGLEFLHSKNIVHRDLKPQNLLLSSRDPQKAVLKIADFGFARFIEPQSVADTLCGSPLYMAPEILLGKPYDAKADLWSVGSILFEMLTGKPPFDVKNHFQLLQELDTARIEIPTTLHLSPECMDLVYSLLKKDSNERISWEEFFRHPWLNPHKATSPRKIPSQRNLPGSRRRNTVNTTTQPILQQQPSFPSSFPHSSIPEDPKQLSPPFLRTSGGSFTKETGFNLSKEGPLRDSIDASTDSFELISSTSSSENTSAHFAPEENTIDEVEMLFKRGTAIAELADIKVGMQSPVEALALYVKALYALQNALEHTKQMIKAQSVATSPRLGVLVDNMRETFSSYLRKAEYWKRNLKPTDSALCAEKIIYECALQMGREAAVSEVLKNYPKAKALYSKGLLLLEQLALEAADTTDQEILAQYVAAFSRRGEEVQKKESGVF